MVLKIKNYDREHFIREIALEGLIIEAFREFNFFLDDEGDVCVELEIDGFTDVLTTYSVTFETLYWYFAESKGIQLTDDEWIIQLIKIEEFVLALKDDFIGEDFSESMEAQSEWIKSQEINNEVDDESITEGIIDSGKDSKGQAINPLAFNLECGCYLDPFGIWEQEGTLTKEGTGNGDQTKRH